MESRAPLAARLAGTVLLAGALLGNLAVLRGFAGGVQAALVAGVIALAVPSALFVGLGRATWRIGSVRLAAGEGLAAGSAVKVALVLSLLLGIVLAGIGFQLAYGPISQFYPFSGSLALLLYRGSLCLPAVGAGIVIAAALLLVEQPRVLIPGTAVVLLADVGLAWAWFERGSGLLGFELAGAGLALPVSALLGAMISGTLLFTVEGARGTLGTHLGRPFDLGDVPQLVRGSLRSSLVLLAVSAGAAVWFALAWRGPESDGTVAVAGALLVCGLAFASVMDAALRAGRPGVAIVAVAVTVMLGLAMLALPRWSLLPWTAVPAADPLIGVRLCGVVLLQEVALAVAVKTGVLRHRRAEGVELAATTAVVVALAVVLALLYTPSLSAMAGVLVVARGLAVPLLRSGH